MNSTAADNNSTTNNTAHLLIRLYGNDSILIQSQCFQQRQRAHGSHVADLTEKRKRLSQRQAESLSAHLLSRTRLRKLGNRSATRTSTNRTPLRQHTNTRQTMIANAQRPHTKRTAARLACLIGRDFRFVGTGRQSPGPKFQPGARLLTCPSMHHAPLTRSVTKHTCKKEHESKQRKVDLVLLCGVDAETVEYFKLPHTENRERAVIGGLCNGETQQSTPIGPW